MGNILALDLSSKSSGWATRVDGELKSGCITDSSTDKYKRLLTMREGVIELVKKYNITKIVLEEVRPEQYNNDEEGLYSHLRNPATAKLLYWLQGIIAVAVYEYNKKIELEFIFPNSWRSKIGIKTGAGIKRDVLKARDIEYVKNTYGLTVNDDEADAIGILDATIKDKNAAPAIKKIVRKSTKDLSSFTAEGFNFK